MISKISTDPTYDAYYEIPEVTYENQELNANDNDTGVYVIDHMRAKNSSKVENSWPKTKKVGHKSTQPGIYDDLYDCDITPRATVATTDQTLIQKGICLKPKKSIIVSTIGGFFIGAIVTSLFFILQSTHFFQIDGNRLSLGKYIFQA